MGQNEGKEKSRRKESGSPRKGIKGKKRGLNRELITLRGKKKQETSIRRKLKRKMNQQRGKAGIPAIRKDRVITPLQESPISVLFIDNTKGGNLAKIFREEERRLGNMTGYNIRVAEMAGMALSRLLPSTNPWGLETVAERIVLYVSKEMKSSKIVRNATYCMRAVAEYARWMERRLER